MRKKIKIKCRGCRRNLITFEESRTGGTLIKPKEELVVKASGSPRTVMAVCPKCAVETAIDVRFFGKTDVPPLH